MDEQRGNIVHFILQTNTVCLPLLCFVAKSHPDLE